MGHSNSGRRSVRSGYDPIDDRQPRRYNHALTVAERPVAREAMPRLPDENVGTTIADLIELKRLLRSQSRAQRRAFKIEATEIAKGYHALCADAPHRKQPYLSKTRNGFAPVDKTGR